MTKTLTLRKHPDRGYQLLLDGADISDDVIALTLWMRGGEPPRVLIEHAVRDVDIDLPDVEEQDADQ
jgi:hypothetical protein